jgi:hypothetical protein
MGAIREDLNTVATGILTGIRPSRLTTPLRGWIARGGSVE